MRTCGNCGCRVYDSGCVNCNEPAYMLEADIRAEADQFREAFSAQVDAMRRFAEAVSRISLVVDEMDGAPARAAALRCPGVRWT